MYRLKQLKAFSLSEVLIAMGLIGILAVTMLSLNNFSDNNYKIAATRLMQIDNALQVWGKAVTKSEITGLSTINSQDSLRKELQNNIVTTSGISATKDIETSEGLLHGGEKLTLNDGSTIEFVALTEGNSQAFKSQGYIKNEYDSPVAVLKVTVPIKNTTKTLSEEYVLTNHKLNDLAQVYEGWKKVEPQTVNGKNLYCIDETVCGKDVCENDVCGCMKDATYCVDNPVYLGPNENEFCDGNGSIIKTQIGTILGKEEKVINTCCAKPKYYAGTNDDGSIKCTCQKDKMTIDKGYGFNAHSATCQSICLKGTYSKDGECVACKAGEYCPNDGMDKPEACPQGYYCPNDNMTEPTSCPKGSYCPNDNMTKPIKCLKGSYCPNDNMVGYILCDIGHYCPNDNMTEAFKCPANSYCPNDLTKKISDDYHKGKYLTNDKNDVIEVNDGGLINSKTCPANAYSTEGSNTCQVCSAGNYLKITKDKNGKIKEKVCVPCPKGTYCPTSGMVTPLDCPVGNYCPETGAITPTECPIGTYQDKTKQTTAKSCLNCPKGKYQDESGQSNCKLCSKGYYQNELGQTECKMCPCGKYSNIDGATSCNPTKAGTYWPNETGKNTPSNGLASPNGIACVGDNHASAAQYCPSGSCSAHPKCPSYGDLYLITDGHGYNKTLNQLIDVFSCITKTGFSQKELNLSGAKRIFIINKQNGKFNLISSGILANNINDIRRSKTNMKVYGSYYYNSSGAVYGSKSCPGAHSSSAMGGTLTYQTPDGVSCKYNVALLGKRVSPLVLDLNGDGKEFTSAQNGVMFDLDADGVIEKTAWTNTQYNFDDAFLCLDRNKNGVIDDGKELFGDQYGAENGFEELKKLDSNNDNTINVNDEIFNSLLLWVDYNKNGIVDYVSNEDYELLNKQIKRNFNQVDLKNNMDCNDNSCSYIVSIANENCKHNKFLFLDFASCNTYHNKQKLEVVPAENGKTIELKTLNDLDIQSISLDYSIERDASGNLLTDGNGNTVGMVGQFTQLIKVSISEAIDKLGNLIDGIIVIGNDYFKSITKTMTDVWFVTDNKD